MLLLNINGEPQAGNQLCWAAVSTMAVRAFQNAANPGFIAPSQMELIARKRARIRTLAQLKETATPRNDRERKLRERLETARHDAQSLDLVNVSSEELWLFDLKSSRLPEGKVLSEEQFRFEMEKRQLPVAISWRYQGKKPTNGRIRTGDHVVLVTGYDPENRKLRIYDPWPAPAPLFQPDPIPAPHEQWITYDTYLNPESGGGMDAVALHELDEFKLRRVGSDALKPGQKYPAYGTIPPRLLPRANHVQLGGDLPGLQEQIDKTMRTHVVRDSSGAVIHGPYGTGMPIPIVPIEASRLVAAGRDVDALFKSDTAAVLVPVLDKNGSMIDSIQMLHEPRPVGWRPGGYTNKIITSLARQARKLHTDRQLDKRGFYLLSMPELCTFYVAHGFHDACSVTSLNSDGDLKNLCGAREPFTQLIKRVQNTCMAS